MHYIFCYGSYPLEGSITLEDKRIFYPFKASTFFLNMVSQPQFKKKKNVDFTSFFFPCLNNFLFETWGGISEELGSEK